MKIVIYRCREYEASAITINNKTVFDGKNYDFHSSARGTKIGGYEVKELWDQGVRSLANALATKAKEKGKNPVITEEILTPEQYAERFE